ncbi:MAG: M3 family oligoendopeptidase [Oscillospiraceae bacterium]|nr:M3 family oligoendopeptidase [Oscillospiraceae bacterium]
MNEVWDLTPIYRGFDDPAFAADMAALENMAEQYNAFAETLTAVEDLEGLRQGILWEEKLTALARKLATYAQLRQSVNTRDSECTSRLGQIMQVLSTTAGAEAAWKEWAAKRPNLMELVERDEILAEYRFLFENLLEDASHLLGSLGEEIAARLELSGGNAWAEMQGYLTSTVPVEYDGGITNLSAIRNLAYDPDPAVRKAAYEAELACYSRIQDPVAFALNSIKLETISDCALRGYASPLDRTLEESHMKRETLEAMLGAMREYLPKFRQYLKAKARLLGYENGLPWYELFAPVGTSAGRYTTEQTRDLLVELFSTFDKELADMVQTAFDDAWIDFYPRDGKTGGAFCEIVDCIGQSRVLTNFDGMFTDIVTLAHELGHAYHNLCIRDHRVLNKDYSMPVAETASTFNECVVMAAAIDRASAKEEKLALIESQLQDVTQIIVDIYSRFRFEAMVFENRQQQFLDADALCGLMTEAQEESYGDGLDRSARHPYMWICKPHYYGPTFYNFPYAFGGLFARGLYAQYEKEGAAFVPKYKKLLYTTPIATAEDAAKVAGIDLTDKDFWRSALQTVADRIDLFCQLVEER